MNIFETEEGDILYECEDYHILNMQIDYVIKDGKHIIFTTVDYVRNQKHCRKIFKNNLENKREYRSKFLKEFQEEFGTNTFPDYDEIYKRYDKIKKENERLKDELETMTFTAKVKQEAVDSLISRIDKANELLEPLIELNGVMTTKGMYKLSKILSGGDEE